MDNEFTADEIREAIAAARIFNSDYGEEQFQASRELDKRLEESGYLGAVCSIAKLEKEKDIHCTEALDAVEQMLSKKGRLEAKIATLEEKRAQCQEETRQAEEVLQQVEAATEQAREELQAVQAERQRKEKGLATFERKAEKGKRAIERELEQCRRKANVTEEETATAGWLKAEVEKQGFGLDLVLGLAQEFAGCEDIRDKLAEGLERGLTLTKWNEEAAEQNEALQSDNKSLAGERQQVVSNLSQLRADTAFEEKIRRFYRRYQSAGPLMEWLASWSDIYFGRCGDPTYDATKLVNRSIRGAYFWTEKQLGGRCPCCSYPRTLYDEGIYQALNLPIGEPYKLQLGE